MCVCVCLCVCFLFNFHWNVYSVSMFRFVCCYILDFFFQNSFRISWRKEMFPKAVAFFCQLSFFRIPLDDHYLIIMIVYHFSSQFSLHRIIVFFHIDFSHVFMLLDKYAVYCSFIFFLVFGAAISLLPVELLYSLNFLFWKAISKNLNFWDYFSPFSCMTFVTFLSH